MEKKVIKPNVSPSFFYGPIIAHEFRGNGISKDRDKYRITFARTFLRNRFQTDFQIG